LRLGDRDRTASDENGTVSRTAAVGGRDDRDRTVAGTLRASGDGNPVRLAGRRPLTSATRLHTNGERAAVRRYGCARCANIEPARRVLHDGDFGTVDVDHAAPC